MKYNTHATGMEDWRVSTQKLAPTTKQPTQPGQYDLYPAQPLEGGRIQRGFDNIAQELLDYNCIVIEGYIGIFWSDFCDHLDKALTSSGKKVTWLNVEESMLPSEKIEQRIQPFLGGDDPVFGTRFNGTLKDFFDQKKLTELQLATSQPMGAGEMLIVYGCGAALCNTDAPVMYVDLPKNELQFRSVAGSVTNLGTGQPVSPEIMYKRFFFVDWPVLNRHKQQLLPRVEWIVDEQIPDNPAIMKGNHFREALHEMSRNFFRVRPWFIPGTWGGTWCKKNIPDLPQNAVNIAWSFELIAPENGLMFTSDEYLLETSFDWLMYQEHEAVLGESAHQFGYEFPIRFDFLDTFDGGNLSLQCHPRPDYIRDEFGESFTQDETYYILDCKPEAQVYLGFQEDIAPAFFREKLEASARFNIPVEVDNFVQRYPARKHDFFLIPHGTIHCSGEGNMVLEISATPYIFTFKMYDWLRLDLNGDPRPLNIDRAFKNLNFNRKGNTVAEELICRPIVIEEGEDWKTIHLPTHEEHFYDVHRLEFSGEITRDTAGSCHVMNLVEGQSIILETENGFRTRLNYAETFVIPAAARSYRLINESGREAKVIDAFLKSEYAVRNNGHY